MADTEKPSMSAYESSSLWMSGINMGLAAIGGVAGGLIGMFSKNKARRTNSENAEKLRLEAIRQKNADISLFNEEMSTTYGADFLSKLNSSQSVTDLIGSIGKDTAIGKQLAEYETLARQAVANAQTDNQQTGMLASMQGQQDALTAHQQEIQGALSEGQAAAAQATSGIRSTGTGDNLRKMQDLQNDISSRLVALGMDQNNVRTILGMKNTQVSASQQADDLRRSMDNAELNALETAMNQKYAQLKENADYDVSIKNYGDERDYWDAEANNGWNWASDFFAGLFGG
jgi:hypothetical protein